MKVMAAVNMAIMNTNMNGLIESTASMIIVTNQLILWKVCMK